MVQAQQPAADEMLWNCVSVDDGKEWQCSGNPQAGQQPPASAPTAEPTAGANTATAAPAPGNRHRSPMSGLKAPKLGSINRPNR